MSNLTDRLDEIEARAAAATKGPWTHGVVGYQDPDGHVVRDADGQVVATADYDEASWHNAAFIANARDDVPALTRALRAVLDKHQPNDGCRHDGEPCCLSCEQVMPCETVTAITAALAGEA